jgi:elongation factor G
VVAGDRRPRKAGQILKVEGREHPEIEGQVAYAGDLIALARIDDLHVDALLHAPGVAEDLAPIKPRLSGAGAVLGPRRRDQGR